MALQSDFMSAINQIAAERGISGEDIFEAIRQAIRTGFKKDFSEEEGALLNIEISEEDGSITVYMDKKVVDKVTSEATQISIAEAKKLEPKLKVGDHVEVDITPEGDFGRVAAQTAKQVILQKLRESEKDAQIGRIKDQIGQVSTAVVQRMEGDSVIWEVNRSPVLMPYEERIPTEFYRSGSRHKVLLKEIRETVRGRQVIVSRADNEFLRGLFELEIPELSSESIEIKGIAREPGQRSKVAVTSNVEGVDPIGACVGQKGVRIMAIMEELKIGSIEEKIDIILWDEDEEQFVINALSPAQVVKTKVTDKKEKHITVIVPDEQLSLAIGRDGQNVRLAAKLTGWNIDIQGETKKFEDGKMIENKETGIKTQNEVEETENEFGSLKLTSKILKALDAAGIKTKTELIEKIEAGEKIKGVGAKSIDELKQALGIK